MGSHPVVLSNCMSLPCALGWAQRQEPIRAALWYQERRQQAGQKHCWDGWEVSAKLWPNCPIAANLPEEKHCWQQDEELTFPFPAKMNSADFSKRSHRFYRLRAEAQVAEEARPAVHHQPCRDTFCLLSS